MLYNGIIEYFNLYNGFGFLKPNDNKKKIFVHFSNLLNFNLIKTGKKIKYTLLKKKKKFIIKKIFI